MKRGLLFTFEGGEGSGKTTQIKLLDKWMEERNIPHITTKEPGSKHINECKEIRKIVFDPKFYFVSNS
jgi:dTMP kinase